MPIRVKCENCKKTLSVKDQLAGKKIKCPVCQNVVVVSVAESTAALKAAVTGVETTPSAPLRGVTIVTTKGADASTGVCRSTAISAALRARL